MKLLLVEDDLQLAGHLILNLKEHGFVVSHISGSEDLNVAVKSGAAPDVVILDRLLGSYDTKASFSFIRESWPNSSILILSAVSTPNERTDLLNLGADDYLGKPFSSSELVARIRALLRRTKASSGSYVRRGNLMIDLVQHSISVDGQAELLPKKEFLLLSALSQKAGRIWSKSELLDYVWGQTGGADTHVVEATVANVRKKLLDLQASVNIKNMRNTGYWIEE